MKYTFTSGSCCVITSAQAVPTEGCPAKSSSVPRRRNHIEAEARKSEGMVTSVSVSATADIASGEIEVPPSALVSQVKPIAVAGTARHSQGRTMQRVLLSVTILAGALVGNAMAQTPDAGCALPSEPQGIPAAIDAAITGPADKDRACMKALLIPEARMMFASLGVDGAPTYTLATVDEWIARVKARGHVVLEEKQIKFHIERYSNIAHLWSTYALSSDGQPAARGINSIEAIKEAGGWRVTSIMVQAESATAPLPKKYLP